MPQHHRAHTCQLSAIASGIALDDHHHSPQRQLIELRIAHADLNSAIDAMAAASPVDELVLRRLKKRRLLRDEAARLQTELDQPESA
jgi:hypothetical protein